MFGHVSECVAASLFVEISADAWVIAVWEDGTLRVEGGDDHGDSPWPHGVRALARYADLLVHHGAHPAGGDDIRTAIRRAAAAVPAACGVDWLPEDLRVTYALAFVAAARVG